MVNRCMGFPLGRCNSLPFTTFPSASTGASAQEYPAAFNMSYAILSRSSWLEPSP